MTDYISREEALKIMEADIELDKLNGRTDWRFINARSRSISLIKEVPAADVKPIVHGKWIPHNEIVDPKHKYVSYGFGYGQCSVCKETIWLAKTKTSEMRYCPNCGAKMIE